MKVIKQVDGVYWVAARKQISVVFRYLNNLG